MKKLYKIILGYSITFWILILLGTLLFTFSLDKISFQNYALRVNWFTLQIDDQYYTNGLYYKGLAAYFIRFPRSKKIVTVTHDILNLNKQPMRIEFTFAYRLDPNQIRNLYYEFGLSYESLLLSNINLQISLQFLKFSLDQFDLNTTQSNIISILNLKNQSVFTYLNLQAFWINTIYFSPQLQSQFTNYQSKANLTSNYGQLLKQKDSLKIDIQVLERSIITNKKNFQLLIAKSYLNKYINITQNALSAIQNHIANMSLRTSSSQIFNYYPPVTIQFL